MTERNQAMKGFNKLARLDDLILPHAGIDAWQSVREQQLPEMSQLLMGRGFKAEEEQKTYDISIDVH